MRQQVPMVFLPLLVYLGAVAYISDRNKFGLMLAQGYFKGQRAKNYSQITTFYDFA